MATATATASAMGNGNGNGNRNDSETKNENQNVNVRRLIRGRWEQEACRTLQTKKWVKYQKKKRTIKGRQCFGQSHVVVVVLDACVGLLKLCVGSEKTFCVLQIIRSSPNYPLHASLATRRHSSRVLSRFGWVRFASTNYARAAFGISLDFFVLGRGVWDLYLSSIRAFCFAQTAGHNVLFIAVYCVTCLAALVFHCDWGQLNVSSAHVLNWAFFIRQTRFMLHTSITMYRHLYR